MTVGPWGSRRDFAEVSYFCFFVYSFIGNVQTIHCNVDTLVVHESYRTFTKWMFCSVHLKPISVFTITMTYGGQSQMTAGAERAPSWQHSTVGFAYRHGHSFPSGLHAPGMLGGHEEATLHLEQSRKRVAECQHHKSMRSAVGLLISSQTSPPFL